MIKFIRTAPCCFGELCEGDTFIHDGDPFIATWEEKGGRLVGINLSTGKLVAFLCTEQIIFTNFHLEVEAT